MVNLKLKHLIIGLAIGLVLLPVSCVYLLPWLLQEIRDSPTKADREIISRLFDTDTESFLEISEYHMEYYFHPQDSFAWMAATLERKPGAPSWEVLLSQWKFQPTPADSRGRIYQFSPDKGLSNTRPEVYYERWVTAVNRKDSSRRDGQLCVAYFDPNSSDTLHLATEGAIFLDNCLMDIREPAPELRTRTLPW